MARPEEKIIRLDLEELESILKKVEVIQDDESLNDAHIEPGELVLRLLKG